MTEVDPLERDIEALLFLSPDPLAPGDIAAACEADEQEVERALESLSGFYAEAGRGLVLRKIAGGWILSSNPESEEAARRLFAAPRTPPLTAAQAETLAIVAYIQPVSRPEIARIRGVSAESAVATLLERGLIEESGRSPFGAVLYRTGELFLRLFGLESLEDLPELGAWDPAPEVEKALRERLLEVGALRSGEATDEGQATANGEQATDGDRPGESPETEPEPGSGGEAGDEPGVGTDDGEPPAEPARDLSD